MASERRHAHALAHVVGHRDADALLEAGESELLHGGAVLIDHENPVHHCSFVSMIGLRCVGFPRASFRATAMPP
jgi:hypothetical protein